ncbi:hypothetical protein Ddc_10800 [Ditylenchus destructor]|nr:hypothetical protein Ddc_10800 [Ditylenchus destructor]
MRYSIFDSLDLDRAKLLYKAKKRFECDHLKFLKKFKLSDKHKLEDKKVETPNFVPVSKIREINQAETPKVIVTAASIKYYYSARAVIAGIQSTFAKKTVTAKSPPKIIFYDLGGITDDKEKKMELKSVCNLEYRIFDWKLLPDDVHGLENFSWKIIILAEMFQEFDSFIYLDTSINFLEKAQMSPQYAWKEPDWKPNDRFGIYTKMYREGLISPACHSLITAQKALRFSAFYGSAPYVSAVQERIISSPFIQRLLRLKNITVQRLTAQKYYGSAPYGSKILRFSALRLKIITVQRLTAQKYYGSAPYGSKLLRFSALRLKNITVQRLTAQNYYGSAPYGSKILRFSALRLKNYYGSAPYGSKLLRFSALRLKIITVQRLTAQNYYGSAPYGSKILRFSALRLKIITVQRLTAQNYYGSAPYGSKILRFSALRLKIITVQRLTAQNYYGSAPYGSKILRFSAFYGSAPYGLAVQERIISAPFIQRLFRLKNITVQRLTAQRLSAYYGSALFTAQKYYGSAPYGSKLLRFSALRLKNITVQRLTAQKYYGSALFTAPRLTAQRFKSVLFQRLLFSAYFGSKILRFSALRLNGSAPITVQRFLRLKNITVQRLTAQRFSAFYGSVPYGSTVQRLLRLSALRLSGSRAYYFSAFYSAPITAQKYYGSKPITA